jgi:hypothetical protein
MQIGHAKCRPAKLSNWALKTALSTSLQYMKKYIPLDKILEAGTKLYTAKRLFTISKNYPESEWQKTICCVESVT